MILAIDMEALTGWLCCGGALLVVLLVVVAVSGSKRNKRSKAKRGSKQSRLDALEESEKQNQRIIDQAYRQFDRLSAEEIKALAKGLGRDLIGEPPTAEREILKHLAAAKRLDTASTLKQIVSIRGELDLDESFLRSLDAKLVPRIDAILTERWNKLAERTAKKITDKVWEDWTKFAADVDDICQGLWSSYGPVPESLWAWNERLEARANEVEEQLPE